MSRVVKSFNGPGQLRLSGGEMLAGRYHVDVTYHPVRRVHEARGSFLLDGASTWVSIVDAEFARGATLLLEDGTEAEVRLGGILGQEVLITAMTLPEPS